MAVGDAPSKRSLPSLDFFKKVGHDGPHLPLRVAECPCGLEGCPQQDEHTALVESNAPEWTL